MALDLIATYPGQVTAGDPAYPLGKAKNVAVVGDGSGTPWEQQIVNDWLGFFQSLLDAAGITPSGVPDAVGASDYLSALDVLINTHTFTAGLVVNGNPLVATAGAVITNGLTALGDSTFGHNLLVGGNLTVNSALAVSGNTTLGNSSGDVTTVTGTLAVVGGLTVSQDLTVADDLTVQDDLTISATGALISNGTGTFNGNTTFDNVATFLPVEGVANFMGGVLFDGGVSLNSTMVAAGNGHYRQKYIEGADANTNYGIANAEFIHVQLLAAPRTYTLQTTGAASGDRITIRTNDNSNVLTIAGISAGNQAMRNASGEVRVATFVFRQGTGWIREHLTLVP